MVRGRDDGTLLYERGRGRVAKWKTTKRERKKVSLSGR